MKHFLIRTNAVFGYTYPEIYDAITIGIRPSFIEAIKDELSELVLTSREDVESIEKDVEEIEAEDTKG